MGRNHTDSNLRITYVLGLEGQSNLLFDYYVFVLQKITLPKYRPGSNGKGRCLVEP